MTMSPGCNFLRRFMNESLLKVHMLLEFSYQNNYRCHPLPVSVRLIYSLCDFRLNRCSKQSFKKTTLRTNIELQTDIDISTVFKYSKYIMSM